jgi:translation initiation factor IF-2
MSEEKTAIRLSKATKELGVGIDHIIDFLSGKGIKVDKNPNTKITSDAFHLLVQEFQNDMQAKNDARDITTEKKNRENLVIEVKETSGKQVQKEVESESDDDLQRSLLNIKQKASEKEKELKVKAKKEVAEEVVAKSKTETAKPAKQEIAKQIKEEVPAIEEEPQVIKAKAKLEAPKVLGKIDLAATEKPKKGAKKKDEKVEEEAAKSVKGKKKKAEEVTEDKVEEATKTSKAKGKKKKDDVEEVVAETPAEISQPVAETVVKETVAEAAPETVTPPAEEEPEQPKDVFRTEREKLTGPTILGKIQLPVDPPKKKPVATSSPDIDDRKKKRKRKDKKVDVNNTQGTNQPQQPRGDFRKPGGGQGGPFRPGQHRGPRRDEPQKQEVTDKQIQDQIKATLARLSGGGKSKGSKLRKMKRDQAAAAEQEALAEQSEKKVIKVTEFVSANELAKMMAVPVTNIISACMSLGLFVSINQRLDAETITVVAEEFGFAVEFVSADVQEAIQDKEDSADDLKPRAPIVTVMGHVDHGKTSLLDYVRKANVIAGEAGGITQHIGAYEVTLESGKKIAFLDTPGHEAFTAMRARGAKVTDVAIIVISADDSVMPQTTEAINHAAAANVPIVFAINKIDKPGANPERIREQLSKMNYLVEDWGGKYQCQEISAKQGKNIDLLLEKVLLEAEMLDLKANPDRMAKGAVIESSLDKGRGYVATILVQTGTLKVGDVMLAGCYSGRIKAMFNERGGRLQEAGPSTPVLILGLNGAPQAGDQFNVMEDEREAREIANKRLQLQREQGIRTHKHITLDEIGRRLAIGNFKELNVIVKGDVDGSIEALSDSLLKLSNPEIQVNVIHKSVGAITESDVLLATASEAIIIGFQVRPTLNARKIAEKEEIEIRLYSIIYDAINEIKAAMEGMLAPEFEEKIVCNIEVRETFKIPKVGTIAGCMVLDGKMSRNTAVRVIREGIVVYAGKLASLKRFKDDVKEVSSGFECGLNIENFNDIKIGDIIEGYEQVAVKRTLA